MTHTQPIRVSNSYDEIRAILSTMLRGESRTLYIDHYKVIVTFNKEGLFDASCYEVDDPSSYPTKMRTTDSLTYVTSWVATP